MKQILIFIFSLIFSLTAYAEVITGEIEYNQQNNEVINPILIQGNIKDSNFVENVFYLLNGVTVLKDRKLAKFSDGSYGVIYNDNPLYSWYYKNGKLMSFSKKSGLSYPCKTIKYNPDGSVINTGYNVSETESYVYSKSGEMIAHWIKGKCMDKENNIIMIRKSFY